MLRWVMACRSSPGADYYHLAYVSDVWVETFLRYYSRMLHKFVEFLFLTAGSRETRPPAGEEGSVWRPHLAGAGVSRMLLAISFCRSNSARRRCISSADTRAIFE